MKLLDKNKIEQEVIIKLKEIMDLELPISIYDLGLVYKIDVKNLDQKIQIDIEMTVINTRCASTKSFTDLIKSKVEELVQVDECCVRFVFSPKWDVSMISAEGLEKLRSTQKL